ncbi:hypothetical protein pb186bvf_015257 [Paramecium bursaria]
MTQESKQNKQQFTLVLYAVSQHLVCNKVSDQPNRLKGACLNKNCKLDRLYCQTCEKDHNHHINDTFSFYQIQQQFFEKPKDNIKYFYEQLDLVKQSVLESTKIFQQQFGQAIDDYQQEFPQIENFSYHQMTVYINKLVKNIRQINQNIIDNNQFELFHNAKQTIQTIINKFNYQMDDIVLLLYDFPNLTNYQDKKLPIQQQLEKEIIFQHKNDQDFGQLQCNDPRHKHSLNKIKKLCLFEGCDLDKLICSRTYDKHSEHKKYQIPVIQFDQQINLFQINEDQAKLISSIQQQIRQFFRNFSQDLQNLSMPHHFVRQIFNGLYSNGNKNDIVKELQQLIFIDVESGDIKYRLAEIKYLKQYIYERIQMLSQNLLCICENLRNGVNREYDQQELVQFQ